MSEVKQVVMAWPALTDEDAERLRRLFQAAPALLEACEGLLAAIVRCEESIDFDRMTPELQTEWDAAYNAATRAVAGLS